MISSVRVRSRARSPGRGLRILKQAILKGCTSERASVNRWERDGAVRKRPPAWSLATSSRAPGRRRRSDNFSSVRFMGVRPREWIETIEIQSSFRFNLFLYFK